MKDKKIRVAVIEDDNPFRIYLETEIRKMPSCSFEYGVASLEVLKKDDLLYDYNPHVLLLDMRLADDYGGGLQVLELLKKKRRKLPKVLIVSGHCDTWMIGLMQQKGNVNGCIRKSALASADSTFLEGIIKKAYQTDEFIVILDYQTAVLSNNKKPTKKPKKLTEIQREILIRLGTGQTQKQVAHHMQKPQRTIGNHVSLLRKKFKVKTTGELMVKVKDLGYID